MEKVRGTEEERL
jgi:hypothetical protein